MQVDYHLDAKAELLGAASFYESRLPGLGEKLLREYDETIAEIVSHPCAYAVVEDDIRFHLMKRFPFAIYYRALPESILVLVVKHHSRDSESWKYRK